MKKQTVQVECPESQSQQVVEIAGSGDQEMVTWCSRCLSRPDCQFQCLRAGLRACFVREVEPVDFALLSCANQSDLLEIFDRSGCSKLPVIKNGRLVGQLTLRRLLDWNDDDRACRAGLCLEDWSELPESCCLHEQLEPVKQTLSVADSVPESVEKLLASGENMAFVVTEDKSYIGAVSALELLRYSANH